MEALLKVFQKNVKIGTQEPKLSLARFSNTQNEPHSFQYNPTITSYGSPIETKH